MNQSSFVVAALREAIQGFVGGSLAWVFTCSLAGAIATAAGTEELRDIDWVWAFAWIGHLLVAAAGLWGLVVLCIHAGCLGALIHGTEQVLRVLLIAFISQLTTSVIVVAGFERNAWRRLFVVWIACTTLAIVCLAGGLRKKKSE
jgi:hypothetical protein